MRKLICLAVFAGAAFVAAPAAAVTTFTFQAGAFSDGMTASGTLTCAQNLDANNSCVVTGISGTVTKTGINDGSPLPIVGFSAYNLPDSRVFYYENDPAYPGHGGFTFDGISFTTSSAGFPDGLTYNFYSLGVPQGTIAQLRETNDGMFMGGVGPGAKVSVGAPMVFLLSAPTVTAVPEPATWALMLGGFGLTGAALRRKSLFVAHAA